VLLTSKAHDDEADTSRNSDLSDLLGRRPDGDQSLNARWRTGLGGKLLDLLVREALRVANAVDRPSIARADQGTDVGAAETT
jgi:hypothetical protein